MRPEPDGGIRPRVKLPGPAIRTSEGLATPAASQVVEAIVFVGAWATLLVGLYAASADLTRGAVGNWAVLLPILAVVTAMITYGVVRDLRGRRSVANARPKADRWFRQFGNGVRLFVLTVAWGAFVFLLALLGEQWAADPFDLGALAGVVLWGFITLIATLLVYRSWSRKP